MTRLLAAVLCLSLSSTALAHAPWIITSEESHPRLFFGGDLSDRDYHVPEAVAEAEIWQTNIDAPAKQIEMASHEEEGFVGLESIDPIEPRGCLRSTIVYGNYHETKLTYYTQHLPSNSPQAWPSEPFEGQAMQAVLSISGDQLIAQILVDSKPAADVKVSLINEADKESDEKKKDDPAKVATTNNLGLATFSLAKLNEGLNAISVMSINEEDEGELQGAPYYSATNILNVTFHFNSEEETTTSALTPLPEAVASFGAVVSDDWLYVYSGHIGQAHDHSCDNLSKNFRRIRLGAQDIENGTWEELAMGQPLQGLPLVAHGGKIYRIGGLDAKNAPGEEDSLHSVSTFASYDPSTKSWTELPSLPNPRSSHNAVVIGDMIYVIGGWQLSGTDEGEWQAGGLSFDLSNPNATWEPMPEPPFKRRALAISHKDGKVIVLGGMNDDANISKQVFFFDPATKNWGEGPELPGRSFHSFGLAAWNHSNELYVNGMSGILYRLSEDDTQWEEIATAQTKRFFHQLVPAGDDLLAVAGVSPEEGHLTTTERLSVR